MSYIIACHDDKGGIGLNNDIPWKNTEEGKNDMKLFKSLTTDNAILMGYNTYKSIGKPLPNRLNIIVSQSHYYEVKEKNIKNLHVFKTIIEAVNFGKNYEKNTKKKCFICGGEKIYNSYLDNYKPRAFYATNLKNDYNCDTFFPLEKLNSLNVKSIEELFYQMKLFTYNVDE